MEIEERVLGKNHPDYGNLLRNIALFEIRTEKFRGAIEKLVEVAIINIRMINQVFSIRHEKKIQDYIQLSQTDYFEILTVLVSHYNELKEFTSPVLDVVLKRKALNLEFATIRRDHSISGDDPEAKALFDEFKNTTRVFANLCLERHLIENPYEIRQRNINTLEKKMEKLEKQLASKIPQIELQRKLEHAEHKAVINLLPEDTFLLEYVWYKPINSMIIVCYLLITLFLGYLENPKKT